MPARIDSVYLFGRLSSRCGKELGRAGRVRGAVADIEKGMRAKIATGLLLLGLFVAGLSLRTDICRRGGDDADLVFAAVFGGAFLVGCSAFLFGRRPTWHPVAPYAIGVIAIPVTIIAFSFLGAFAWALSCSR